MRPFRVIRPRLKGRMCCLRSVPNTAARPPIWKRMSCYPVDQVHARRGSSHRSSESGVRYRYSVRSIQVNVRQSMLNVAQSRAKGTKTFEPLDFSGSWLHAFAAYHPFDNIKLKPVAQRQKTNTSVGSSDHRTKRKTIPPHSKLPQSCSNYRSPPDELGLKVPPHTRHGTPRTGRFPPCTWSPYPLRTTPGLDAIQTESRQDLPQGS